MVPVGFVQVPLAQVVPIVHPSLSSHGAPLLAGWPPWHTPLLHVSPAVQSLPSLHAPPLLPGTAMHVLLASSQAPTMHTSPGAVQVLGAPAQMPLVHTSLMVQKRPSSHEAPLF